MEKKNWILESPRFWKGFGPNGTDLASLSGVESPRAQKPGEQNTFLLLYKTRRDEITQLYETSGRGIYLIKGRMFKRYQ